MRAILIWLRIQVLELTMDVGWRGGLYKKVFMLDIIVIVPNLVDLSSYPFDILMSVVAQ